MHRPAAITINYTESIDQYLISIGLVIKIDYEDQNVCTTFNKRVLFVDPIILTWDQMIGLLELNPNFYDGDKWQGNFVCWTDNGAEILVKNNEYKDYNINQLYVTRKGTYDVIDEVWI